MTCQALDELLVLLSNFILPTSIYLKIPIEGRRNEMESEIYITTKNWNQELTPGRMKAEPVSFTIIGFNGLGPLLYSVSENNLSQQIQE